MSDSATHSSAEALERRILFFTCAAHALTHVYLVIHQTALLEMSGAFGLSVKDFSTDYAMIGMALFGFGSVPAALLGERYGEKALLVAFFWLTAAAGVILACAHGPASLLVGMVCLGLGTSIFHPVGNTLIAKGMRAQGPAMGTNGLWGSLGTSFGPALTGIALGLYSWRLAYAALALPMVIFGVWMCATRIELEPARRSRAAAGTEGRSRGIVILLLVAMTLTGLQFWILTHMLPTFIQSNTSESLLPLPVWLRTDSLRKGVLTSVIYAVGGLGQYYAGRLVHGKDGRGTYLALLGSALVLVPLAGGLRDFGLVAVASAMSLVVFAIQPIENVLLSRFAPPGWNAMLFGLKFTLAFGIGSGVGTRVSAVASERWGPSSFFTAASGATAAAIVVVAIAWMLPAGRRAPERVSA